MGTLEDAIRIAVEAHAGQKDKAGRPYILHPLRVMQKMRTDDEMTVAILHDLVEDTDWTLDRLREAGFSDRIVRAVNSLTRREGEDYEAFCARAGADPIGRGVKIADLEDNMDSTRMATFNDHDLQRHARYHRAWCALTGQPPADAQAGWRPHLDG